MRRPTAARSLRLIVTWFIVAAAGAAQAAAQVDSTTTIVPGAHYAPGSAFHEALLGSDYRDAWATPIEVPVLNLETFAGGLEPVRTGGFQQTRSLRFQGADGREYNFRSVDKELTPAMPEFTRETVVDWVRQDQTSAQLPSAPIIATALLNAVGVLNPGPVLYVMPDDPRLGVFRREFAGMLGTLEVHPNEGPENEPLFEGAERVSGTERLIEHLEEDLEHRVDARGFLRARLMDVLLGDYDRHEGQWRWARYTRGDHLVWSPVPEDRDYGFVAYDGALLTLARKVGIARLVDFGASYPNMLAMVDNSLALTRRLLGEPTWEMWEEEALFLQRTLTDEVIAEAVRTMPPSHYALYGEELEADLRVRRDRLPAMARDFYLLLSQTVEVHGTEEDDRVEVERNADQTLTVRLFVDEETEPRYQRVLQPDETDEVRIFLDQGDDEALITGTGEEIAVRIIGGEDDDVLTDRSSGRTSLHDFEGDNTLVAGRNTWIDELPWPRTDEDPDLVLAEAEEPAAEEGEGDADAGADDEEEGEEEEAIENDEAEDLEDLIPGLERDWGESSTWFRPFAGWESHAELVVGGGPQLTRYSFRHAPYRSRLWVRGLYAPLATRFGVEGGMELHRSTSSGWLDLYGRASNLDATVFYGFGNDTQGGQSPDFRIWERRATLRPTYHLRDSDRFNLRLGPVLEHIDPDPDVVIAVEPGPDAMEALTRLGGEAGARFDLRDDRVFPTRGLLLQGDATFFPAALDLESELARFQGEAGAYLPLSRAVLALRAGGSAVAGDFRYYDAAFVGGSATLRGHRHQRFAGDRAAFGGAELRVPITPATIVVHGTLGTSIFADAGRVWFEGDSPGGWHTAVGGSLWFHVPVGLVSLSYARGEQDRFYFGFGLPF